MPPHTSSGPTDLVVATVLWRRVDCPGHDACRLIQRANGWALDGVAVYLEGGAPVQLRYSVALDRTWRSMGGEVHGWSGAREVSLVAARLAGGAWTLNGRLAPGLEECDDLDFGFTPATNLSQLRRLDLAEGARAFVPVAWLDVDDGALTLLPQHYRRRSAHTYWYEAPTVPYSGLLEIASTGFCIHYPGLWTAETG